jgi:hypothetical protein
MLEMGHLQRMGAGIGIDEANQQVKVVVEPTNASDSFPPTNRQEWREFVQNMAGCISDPTFERQGQGGYEQRSKLFL